MVCNIKTKQLNHIIIPCVSNVQTRDVVRIFIHGWSRLCDIDPTLAERLVDVSLFSRYMRIT